MFLMKPELVAEYRKQMDACHESNNVYKADAKYNFSSLGNAVENIAIMINEHQEFSKLNSKETS